MPGCTRRTDDEKSVYKVLDQLNEAYRHQDGAAVSLLLNSSTRYWYEDVIEGVVNDSHSELEARGNCQLILILRLRILVEDDPISQVGMYEAFQLGTTGLLPADPPIWTVRNLNIQGDIATAGIIENRNSQSIYFTRENDEWKFSMIRSIELQGYAIEKIIDQSGQDRIQWLKEYLWSIGLNDADISRGFPEEAQNIGLPPSGQEDLNN